MQWGIDLLIVQGVLGAYDVLWHHEWKERLPTRAEPAHKFTGRSRAQPELSA